MNGSKRVKLEPIRIERKAELEWLYRLLRAHHSTPKIVLPTRKELRAPGHFYFRAIATAPREARGGLIGITSYLARTRFLAETQKTVVLPGLRGQGWGEAVSRAIEERVKRDGFSKVITTIYSTNFVMLSLKLKQGYTIEGYHPDHEAPGLHEYSLGKVLRR